MEPEKVRDAMVKMLSALHKRFGKAIVGRIQPFNIYAHDIDCVFFVFPGENRCFVREHDAEVAAGARYAMCSQAAW